jgi:uncharacterized protein with GYD domain
MATYALLTRLTPEALKSPNDMIRLEQAVADRIRRDCPEVRWLSSFAILGPCDYLDLFEAPDEIAAAKVAAIVRSFGHARTETWTAVPWERFKLVIATAA